MFSLLPLSAFAAAWPSRCHPAVDASGHHRAACSRAGVLERRGFALESAASRFCREAGGRVTTNVLVIDLDVAVPNALDGRRLEVVADGLPLFGGAQLAVDTTLVSLLHAKGSPHRHAADTGRWSDEEMAFLLARAKASSEPRILKKRVEQAWRLRWLSMLGCAAAWALACVSP